MQGLPEPRLLSVPPRHQSGGLVSLGLSLLLLRKYIYWTNEGRMEWRVWWTFQKAGMLAG